MTFPLQSTSTTLAAPEQNSWVKRMLKTLCYRALAPGAETAADRTQAHWQGHCVARADELSCQLNERYTLFVGLHREGLLVANLLANRFGASLAELQALRHGISWISNQVKEVGKHNRVLVIMPTDPQFTDLELDCLDSSLNGLTAHATSVEMGAPILAIKTVSAIAHGPLQSPAKDFETSA